MVDDRKVFGELQNQAFQVSETTADGFHARRDNVAVLSKDGASTTPTSRSCT